MPQPVSQSLSALAINAAQIEFYEGSIELEQRWYESVKPDEHLNLSEWADKYRILSPKSAAEPGKWRTSRTPYLKEIMDCLSTSSTVQRVVFMKGAQIGGSEAGINFIGYVIHMAPGPMMAVSPTVEMAKRSSRQRIDPQLEEVPELRERVAPARSRDSGNTILSKDFPGGVLVLTGANSAVGLRSMPARYLFMDEVDGYPGDVEGEGDPILLAERRSATFARRRKIFLVSTPTIKGTSRIQREFLNSDQRYYHVPCPHCGHFQPLRFEQLRWNEGEYKDVRYCCETCHELISEHHKTSMLERGLWIAKAEGDGLTQGYHLSSLYSPVGWFSWADAVRMYEDAKQNPELMKGFVNTVLGEPYEEEYDAPEWDRLYERRESYQIGVVPEGGLFLTAGVDIQRDRIECEIVAWGRDKRSWSVDYQVLDGNTAEKGVWDKLDKVLSKDWPHVNGSTLPIRVMCVDSGYATQDVYNWVRQYPQAIWGGAGARASQPRTVVAIKGRDTETALIQSVSKADTGSKRRGLRVWNISGPVAKVELYRWLKLPRPTQEELDDGETHPSGSCYFPQYGQEYFKQLTAEKRIVTLHKGFPKASWVKDPSINNEALDCRVYARAAASIYGLDRFKELQWRRIENSMGDNNPNQKTSSIAFLKHSQQKAVQNKRPVQQQKSFASDDPYL